MDIQWSQWTLESGLWITVNLLSVVGDGVLAVIIGLVMEGKV